MKKKYLILELIIIFTITLIYNLMGNILANDEIWSYGFSYNMYSGLIPYKDFNMIITPMYPFINTLIMKIFGSNYLVFHIFNAIMCTSIFYLLKKISQNYCYISYILLTICLYPNYSLMCLLLLLLLINLERKKSNDYLIGIILGITFLTKQNIGIYLCIPTLFTKDIKKIIKRIIGFIIPNIIFLIYLLSNNCLYEFIDYTVLGVKNFTTDNTLIKISMLIIVLISIIYLIYKYYKTKDITLIYFLCFLGMSYPIMDNYHTMMAFAPIVGYFLNNFKIDKRIIIVIFISFIIGIILANYFQYKNMNYKFPNESYMFKYRKITEDSGKNLNYLSDYINNLDGYVFIINLNAYSIKLNGNIKINKYDLLNNGNMGHDGDIRIINEFNEICRNNKCTFLIDKDKINEEGYSQYNKNIHNYVIDNYRESGKVSWFTIYKNK